MKRSLFIFLLFCLLCSACTAPRYVTIPETHTQTREHYVFDTLIQRDTIMITRLPDTVITRHDHFIYRIKHTRDSVYLHDTILRPYPVEVIKEVKTPLTKWQIFAQTFGTVALLIIIIGAFIFVLIRCRNH